MRELISKNIKDYSLEISYSNVRNLTKKYNHNVFDKPCVHVEFRCDKNDINCSYLDQSILSKRFKKKKMNQNINLYVSDI